MAWYPMCMKCSTLFVPIIVRHVVGQNAKSSHILYTQALTPDILYLKLFTPFRYFLLSIDLPSSLKFVYPMTFRFIFHVGLIKTHSIFATKIFIATTVTFVSFVKWTVFTTRSTSAIFLKSLRLSIIIHWCLLPLPISQSFTPAWECYWELLEHHPQYHYQRCHNDGSCILSQHSC